MKRAEEKKWIVDGLSWVEMGKKERSCAAAVVEGKSHSTESTVKKAPVRHS